MEKKTQALFEARAAVMKALAHPSRLFIVDRLAQRDHSVQELADMVGADISTVSRHLSVLRGAGLVKDRREARKVFYHLVCPCALDFFTCVETVIKTSAREQAALLD
jgi:ArsR family transcriptional regulator